MADFILTMRGRPDAWNEMSSGEKEQIMKKYFAFVDRLRSEGRYQTGSPLKPGGFALNSRSDRVQVDGPFTETRETLNGYFIFSARDIAEAVEISKDCPALTHGETVEVFELGNH
jgi:hypothetical protein